MGENSPTKTRVVGLWREMWHKHDSSHVAPCLCLSSGCSGGVWRSPSATHKSCRKETQRPSRCHYTTPSTLMSILMSSSQMVPRISRDSLKGGGQWRGHPITPAQQGPCMYAVCTTSGHSGQGKGHWCVLILLNTTDHKSPGLRGHSFSATKRI